MLARLTHTCCLAPHIDCRSSQRTVAVPEQVLPVSANNGGGTGSFFDSSGVRKAVLLARYTDILHDW